MNNADTLSQDRIKELKMMALGFHGTIVGLTENPYEAVVLVTMIHLMLWMNHREPNADTKLMLEEYVQNFLENFEQNEAHAKGQMQ